jgi:hypothetical protein
MRPLRKVGVREMKDGSANADAALGWQQVRGRVLQGYLHWNNFALAYFQSVCMTSNFYLEIAISAEIGKNSDDVFSDRSAQKPMGLVAPFLLDIGHCCPATSD